MQCIFCMEDICCTNVINVRKSLSDWKMFSWLFKKLRNGNSYRNSYRWCSLYLFSTMAKFSIMFKFAAVKSEIIPLFESALQRPLTLQSLEWFFAFCQLLVNVLLRRKVITCLEFINEKTCTKSFLNNTISFILLLSPEVFRLVCK